MDSILDLFKSSIEKETKALKDTLGAFGDNVEKVVTEIANLKGKVIIMGVGKTGHIGEKIAASLSSLGTPSFFVHATEAMHGDLGMIEKKDLVIIISNSGETKETNAVIAPIKRIGAKIVGISRNENSTLIKNSDFNICYKYDTETDSLNLAPTTSTIIVLAIGDALATTLAKIKGFTREDFHKYHPGGALGKELEGDKK